MAGITLTEAQSHLDMWLEADRQVTGGQSYQYEGRILTRANAAEIRSNITYWNDHVIRLSSAGFSRLRRVVPL